MSLIVLDWDGLRAEATKHFPHALRMPRPIRYGVITDARQWAFEQFGPCAADPKLTPILFDARMMWATSGVSFWFKDEKDAIWFKLRWC